MQKIAKVTYSVLALALTLFVGAANQIYGFDKNSTEMVVGENCGTDGGGIGIRK